jgi:hypothetical protein
MEAAEFSLHRELGLVQPDKLNSHGILVNMKRMLLAYREY